MCECGCRARRRAKRGGVGKIVALRAKARGGDLGVAADCVLATFGFELTEDDDVTARACVGAFVLLEALAELKVIRLMLTPKDAANG